MHGLMTILTFESVVIAPLHDFEARTFPSDCRLVHSLLDVHVTLIQEFKTFVVLPICLRANGPGVSIGETD